MSEFSSESSPLENRVHRGEHDVNADSGSSLVALTQEMARRMRLYEAVMSSTPDLQYVFDLDYRFVYANEALLAMWGKTWDEAIGKSLLENGYEPWHAEMHEREIDTVVATRAPIRGVVPFSGTQGRRVYDYIFVPVIGEDGEVEAVAGTTRDITDLKEKEDELRRSEERFRNMADTAPAMLWITDTDNQTTFLSKGWYEYTTQTPGEGLGQGWFDAIHPDDRAHSARIFHAAAAERKPFSLDHRLRVGPDEYRWVIDTGHPRFGDDGQWLGYIGSVVDAHERKMHEEALVEADQRKDRFMAVLSHELRNPLAPIKNSLHVLERAAPHSEQARSAREILERQVDQLARLVDDLLEATRVSQDKIQLQCDHIELNELLHRTIEDHRSLFDRRHITLESVLCEVPINVYGDKNRLAQIVGNLLQNAAKFTPSGGLARVVVEVTSEDREACITVTDTGLGMTEETLESLFEPFVQADASLDHSAGGLGLGLSLVKGLVELHGGEVFAMSDGPDLGATFEVRLPTIAPVPTGAIIEPQPSDSPHCRILLIEDNPDVALGMRMILELKGHEVFLAHHGREGLELARDLEPDVIICDIGLPEMDGYAVARSLRSEPELEDVFLIALSGYAMPSDIEKSRAAGFDRHLAKPPDLETLDGYLSEVQR